MRSFGIAPLKVEAAFELSKMLKADSTEYSKYFQPFRFDEDTLTAVLSAMREDQFWGVYSGDALVGFFMLRGFDAGFSIPSYGVYIAEKFSGNGISKLTLQFVRVWCRMENIPKVMIKVHPQNQIAKKAYEKSGAVLEGLDPKNANLIYALSIL
ncbi:MAG: hypothetical protein A2X26_13200 [Chloroflexi bacterium GWC2_49_37]|nr:MAG: hypothetical protein A2X26_13200 [Chloroflexi bacterium GWC2_49_37]